ncbi:MAG: cadherin-like beta sandwich domain-containing protein, partial [Clostridia bacterium]|nr:cadherin-like beta sandwich domain-containing protein [Clostridia bacterium]
MKKVLSCILLCALLLPLLFVPAMAATASVNLSASAATVYMGNRVSVYIKVQGSEKIGSWNFSLTYDPAYLEYVSGADAGGGGSLLFVDSSDGVASVSKTVVFKTKRLGQTKVTLNPTQIIGFDSMKPMSVSAASRSIQIVAAPTLSGDNALSSLSVSPGTLEPAFDPATLNYTLSVPFEVTELTVSGTPAHQAATVSASGAALVVGENKVEVVCTAQNGSRRVYTITVTRQQSELAGVTATVKDKTYTVSHDPSTLTVPEGFTPSSLVFGEKKILAYLSPKGSIAIAHLTSETDSAWFIFDQASQSFSPFVTLPSVAQSFVILTPPAEESVPAGFVPHEITVGEAKYSVYKSRAIDSEHVFLVYAMSQDGTLGFYYYDQQNGTFLSHFTSSVMTGSDEGMDEDAKQKLLEAEEKNNRLEIILLALALGAVLLIIGLIL